MSDSRDTYFLIEVALSHHSIYEDQTHILLLAVSLFGQACLQYRKLHVLQCVIGLVEVSMYRKVILPLMTSLRCSLKRFANLRPVSLMLTCRWTFDVRQIINHAVRDAAKTGP